MEQLMAQNPWLGWLIIILLVWSLPWKAMALWRAAKNGQKIWFIIFILFNTVGILEIIYLLFFGHHREIAEEAEKKMVAEENKTEESSRRPASLSTSPGGPVSTGLGGPIV